MILVKRMRNWMELLFVGSAMVIVAACGSEEAKLDKTTRQQIESLARTEMIRLDDSLKTICDSIYATTYKQVIDSLYNVRQAEIQQIISEE